LLDVYNCIDCEFYFEPGRTYLFFADVAKSSRPEHDRGAGG
jgi:hypothetical protein